MKKLKLLIVVTMLFFLFGCSDKNSTGEEISTDFFSEGLTTQRMNVNTSFESELPDKMDLCINQVLEFQEGALYELRLDYENDFSGRVDENGDRLHLGYFYVENDRIFRIRETDADNIITCSAEELKEKGTLVCSPNSVVDKSEGEKGFHERIETDADICTYFSYNDTIETGFFENITWERGKGLVKYESGYGAMRDYLGLSRSENTSEDVEKIREMEEVYKAFLNGEKKAQVLNSKGEFKEFSIWKLPGFIGEEMCRYLYMDIDGDGFEELHMCSLEGVYYIFKYSAGEIKAIFKDESGNQYPIHEGKLRGILYYSTGENQNETVYGFSEMNEDGECIQIDKLVCFDINENGEFDAQDVFWNEDVSGKREVIEIEEWNKRAEPYINTDIQPERWNIKEKMQIDG